MSRRLKNLVFAGIVGLAACSSSDAVAPAGPQVVSVKFSIPLRYDPLEDAYYNSDTAEVTAIVVDGSGTALPTANVDWRLDPSTNPGSNAPIALLEKTGPQTAHLFFNRNGLIGVVATVTRDDGTKISSALYLDWNGEPF